MSLEQTVIPPPGTALVEELDQRLVVQLRDGRKLIGVLRSFDQFANLVLEGTAERVIVGDQYADVPLGLHVVRGENVVLLARLDGDKEPPPGLAKVSEADIRTAQRAEREQDRVRRTMKARLDFVFDLE